MKIPARCNRRECQARRNLTKRPELHKQFWPTCHIPGCNGKMYVDEYRLRRGSKDHPHLCRDDCLPYPHKVSTIQCKLHGEYMLEKSLKPKPKHSPIPDEQDCPF